MLLKSQLSPKDVKKRLQSAIHSPSKQLKSPQSLLGESTLNQLQIITTSQKSSAKPPLMSRNLAQSSKSHDRISTLAK